MKRPLLAPRKRIPRTPDHSLLPIRAENLVFERNGRRLIDNVTLTLPPTGVTVILGPNGAGKSLLLRLMAHLIVPDSGQVMWGDAAPDYERALGLGVLLQRPVLLRRSALANLTYPLKLRGVPRGERDERARMTLAAAELLHIARSPARLLSGGEQRRLALARTLVSDPEVLFLDEPGANLDPHATAAVEHLIKTTHLSGVPTLLITHDIGRARRLGNTVLFMVGGRVLEMAPAKKFFDEPESREAKAYLSGEIVL